MAFIKLCDRVQISADQLPYVFRTLLNTIINCIMIKLRAARVWNQSSRDQDQDLWRQEHVHKTKENYIDRVKITHLCTFPLRPVGKACVDLNTVFSSVERQNILAEDIQ